MIHVPRDAEPSHFRELVAKWRSTMATQPQRDSYSRRSGSPHLDRRVREALVANFHGKCAYCESVANVTGVGEVELYRPRNAYGEEATLDWSNLLYACPVCNRNKAAAFPLAGEPSPRQADYAWRIENESALLLHPCIDFPEDHLRFGTDGMIFGLTERGRVTIEVLDLNRPQLVNARKSEGLYLLAVPDIETARALSPERPYLGFKRQLLQQLANDSFAEQSEQARREQNAFDDEREAEATDTADELSWYWDRPHYIEKIELENVGAIDALTLDLSLKENRRMPCFALLGNNGVGKSTVLKAIAAALAGKDYARKLGLSSNALLAHGAKSGKVVIRVTGYRDDVELELRRGRALKFHPKTQTRAFILGYGSTRLLATRKHKTKDGARHAKLANLFDPFVPVSDPSSWLDSIPYAQQEEVRLTLDILLNCRPDEQNTVVLQDGKIRFVVGGTAPQAVSTLSDGYKALIGMATDIISVMYKAKLNTIAEAKGIVLIDELGNHFHPEWKLRILGALRTAFPQVQFIYSTHEPLCLRGLEEGELAVLRRDTKGVYLLNELPPVSNLRIDQLLTSEHFGLGSTVDPDQNEKIERYHALVLKTDRNNEEVATLAQLEHELSATAYLGGSQRERMLLRLLDLSLEIPVRAPGQAVSAKSMSDRTVNKLKDIMRAVEPGMGRAQ
jgi:uncharacterized protein (TIGR02646 family)